MRTYSFGCGSLLRYIGLDDMCIVLSDTNELCNEFLVMSLDINTGKLHYHYTDQIGKVVIIEY